MSSLVTVLILVVGAFIASSTSRGGYGFVSGAEYILLGALLGPLGLGVIDDELLQVIRPVLLVATAWVGLLFGFRMRAGELYRLGWWGALLIVVEAGGTLLIMALALPRLGKLSGHLMLVEGWLPLGLAVVSAASTKSTALWARTRLRPNGPTTDRLLRITRHDDIVTIAGLLLLFAGSAPPSMAPLLGGHLVRILGSTLGLGVFLGGAFILLGGLLDGRRPDRETAWVLLVGVILLGSGVAARLGLPVMVVLFVVGCILSTSNDPALLDEISEQTERPVMIFLLVLVGLCLTPTHGLSTLIPAVVVLRLSCKLILGAFCGLSEAGGFDEGAGLLGFGGVALAAAVQIHLAYGGRAGTLILFAAVGHALVGDLFGPLGLRALLLRRGEIATTPLVESNSATGATPTPGIERL